ncbi:MAG TPA: hypothetical protein VMR50_12000 [Myxococcota bacterium]|nr:hypothetical protein [Myxococcota bacterium]
MSDERWIEAVRSEFQPEPLAPARAAELRRDLDARIEARRGLPRFAFPAFASAVAAAALYLAWPHAAILPTSDGTVSSGELDAFVDPDQLTGELTDQAEYLPADYQGLALLLDDDAADR